MPGFLCHLRVLRATSDPVRLPAARRFNPALSCFYKKCKALAKTRVVDFSAVAESAPEARDTEVQTTFQTKTETPTMRKLILLATVIGFAAAIQASAADAKENWEKTCSKCHGPDGKGQTKMGEKLGIKDYTDAKVQEAFKDDEAFKAVKEGLKDAEGKVRMKPAEGLSDDEIKALVQYVRGFKK